MPFHFYRQNNSMDCGPVCLRMIAKYYGKHYRTESIRRSCGINKQGTSILGLSEAAEKMGFRTRGVLLNERQLLGAKLPCILHWSKNHFVVLLAFYGRNGNKGVKIADPARGILKFNNSEFLEKWISSTDENNVDNGIALLLEPTTKFFDGQDEEEQKLSWHLIFQYLKLRKRQIIQVFIALLLTSFIQLIFPFLAQNIVDTGISNKSISFISLILLAQFILMFSKTIIDFIRSRILLRISNIVNISILSDFWIKLSKLVMSYFEVHQTGDTLQRINDHRRIQDFLTGSSLNTLFSLFSLAILSIAMFIYSYTIFAIFVISSIFYFLWILLFLKIRRKINYKTFYLYSKENNATIQFIQGMNEIRLGNAVQFKRWDWENIQAKIFKLNFKTLSYNQWQEAGALFINQGKDLLITFLAARSVIQGDLTLGGLLAVQYILGQLSSPVEQIVEFIQSAQDAKISLERLNEVHQLPNEEKSSVSYIDNFPRNQNISFKNVSFHYPGSGDRFAIKDINLDIPIGKFTAIVGASGSGKTTLLKLLLKFYDDYNGQIKVGDIDFRHIRPASWRACCGAVLQDGFIFNDTIAKNITLGHEYFSFTNLVRSCEISNILPFIDGLPNGFYSQLGIDGIGISQGQRQRLLIARAVYKDPDYIFFDEATNALDSKNEKLILENLYEILSGKTIVVIAHRLSTIKNADKIIVLDEGTVVEQGNYVELLALKGKYFELIQNQLELIE